MKVFEVNGYWKDDSTEFEGELIAEFDDVPDGWNDEDFLFFGLSEEDLINSSTEDGLEFVITSYSIIKN